MLPSKYPHYQAICSTSWTQEHDIPLILAKAQHLQDTIESLIQERVSLLGQVNLLQPTIEKLPDDVLSLIFQHAYEDGGKGLGFPVNDLEHEDDQPRIHCSSPVILGVVCSRWRTVAWSTPRIWTSLYMEVAEWNIKRVTSLLILHAENAGNHPLHVEFDLRRQQKIMVDSCTELDYEEEACACDLLPLEPLETLLFERYAKRIKTLRPAYPPLGWAHQIDGLPNLETLALGWPTSARMFTPFNLTSCAALSQLKHIELSLPYHATSFVMGDACFNLEWPRQSWETTTVLQLRGVDYEECVRVFWKCQNLHSFSMLVPISMGMEDEFPSIPPATKVYSKLEHFEWTFPSGELSYLNTVVFKEKDFLRTIDLPFIKSMTLHDAFKKGAPHSEIRQFLSRLPSSLRCLSFTSLEIHHWDPKHWTTSAPMGICFPSVPNTVTKLILDGCCITGLLQFLFPIKVSSDDDNTLPVLFPTLTHLECRDSGTCNRKFRWTGFVNTMRYKKRLGLTEGFCLTVPKDWDGLDKMMPKHREALGKLKKNGFNVQINLRAK